MLVFLFLVDVQQLSVSKKELLPDDCSPRLDQKDLKLLQVKKEQEEADIIAFTFSPASVYSEDDDKKPQSSEPHLNQTEESRDSAGPKPGLDLCLESNHGDKTSDASEKDSIDGNWEESGERLSALNCLRNQNVSVGNRRRENGKKLTAALTVVKQSTTVCIC